MGKPLFTFGQPQVKWTEIDDSIVLPIHQNQEKNTLVFIDSEWGEPNKLRYISDSQTYVEKFGKLIDPTKSQKGYDYLPHYLQGNLQGNIPMYVYKIGFPDTGKTIDDYKQMTKYQIENYSGEFKEFIQIKQKYQGLFGKNLGIKVYYNSLFKMYSIDVINLLTYVEQSENDDSEMEILESFKEDNFINLIDKVNNRSKYVEIHYSLIQTMEEQETIIAEDLVSQVDGQNQTFTVQNTQLVQDTVSITKDLNEELDITNETPTGDIDGQNQTFTLQNDSIISSSLEITLSEYTDVTSETPTGDIDGQNQTFTLQNTDIYSSSLEITLIEQVTSIDETPTGDIDGQNQTFDLVNDDIEESSVNLTLTEYTDVTSETPTGDINSTNMTYTLQNSPVIAESFSVVVDGGTQITDTDNGDGTGTLSDGGSITYSTGEFTLNQQPTTTVVQDYTYSTDTQITDDGQGNLSDGGTIDYVDGSFILNSQPQTGSDLIQEYNYDDQTLITDDGQGNLSDGGTITYSSGEFTLNSQPQQEIEMTQDYQYVIETSITDTDNGDGTGTLSDGGSITYQTGEFTLNQQPQSGSDLSQDYTHHDVEYITDDGQGNLSDGGTITYSSGEFTLTEQPTHGLVVNYTHDHDVDYNLTVVNVNPENKIYTEYDLGIVHDEIDANDGETFEFYQQTDTSENGIYNFNQSTQRFEKLYWDFTYRKLYDLLQNDSYIIDFTMQYKNLSDEIIPRVKQQDQLNYYDGVTDSIIKDNLSQTTFNEQASLEVDFSEGMTQLVENYEITSPDFGKIRYIQTLGLQQHTQFNDETSEHYEEYEQFINNIHTKLIQPRRNLVLITEPKDYSGEDQVTNQLQSSNDIWSDLKGSYIAMYQPWILEKRAQLDLHLPPSFDVIQKLYQHTPNLQVQGIRRGRISESSIPVHVLSDSDKDDLSQDNVNSLMYFPHYKGTYIWDEKTHYNKLSQLSRLSQRLIMIEIEERVNREMGFFLMESLVESTFNRIEQKQDYILSQYRRMNWIYDYQIDLDTSLELLDNHMVILKLLIKPIKNLEFIEIKQFVRSYQNQTAEF